MAADVPARWIAKTTQIGIKIAKQIFQITFSGVQCVDASEIAEEALADLDFYLEMEPENWQLMLENIKSNGHTDLGYTLNTLDLFCC